MGRPSGKQTNVRLSDTHLKRLAKIRKCGDFSDDSAALRWCIDFTNTMLGIIPAAVAETYISSFAESEGTTALSIEPEGTTYPPGYPYSGQADVQD
ncbi:MAG: hypothetical protein PHH85_01930 [Candidatus Methanoperedens sp.]|nr:hypothetical protein [Candidatus Methanoperedens sp.]